MDQQVHPLPERHGFAGAVQYGCSLAGTPYVLVVQHDRLFVAGSVHISIDVHVYVYTYNSTHT